MRIDTKYSIGDTVQLQSGAIGVVTELEISVTVATKIKYSVKVSDSWTPLVSEADIKSKVKVTPLS